MRRGRRIRQRNRLHGRRPRNVNRHGNPCRSSRSRFPRRLLSSVAITHFGGRLGGSRFGHLTFGGLTLPPVKFRLGVPRGRLPRPLLDPILAALVSGQLSFALRRFQLGSFLTARFLEPFGKVQRLLLALGLQRGLALVLNLVGSSR